MKKPLKLVVLVLFTLACSISSVLRKPTPTASPIDTPTARVEVVYRPVKEMNLRTQSDPTLDLKEAEVPDPPKQPLLPEAEDQDIRAFVGNSSEVSLETSVILVPSRTERSIAELIDHFIEIRRPGARRDGSEEGIEIGDRAGYLPILTDCGPGYILVFIRNNIIAYVIGCGHDLDLEKMRRVGVLIDERITAPPSAAEIARATQMAGASPTPGAIGSLVPSLIESPSTPDLPVGVFKISTDIHLVYRCIEGFDYSWTLKEDKWMPAEKFSRCVQAGQVLDFRVDLTWIGNGQYEEILTHSGDQKWKGTFAVNMNSAFLLAIPGQAIPINKSQSEDMYMEMIYDSAMKPIGEEVIQIMGKSILAYVYEYKYLERMKDENKSCDFGFDDAHEVKIFFDKTTGIRLKDINLETIEDFPCGHPNPALIGSESSMSVYELVETNLKIGDK